MRYSISDPFCITDCRVFNINAGSTIDGGAFYISGATDFGVICMRNTFYECRGKHGGAIYILGITLYCSKCCSNNCWASAHYGFVNAQCSTDGIIMMNMTSTTKSGSTAIGETVMISGGYQIIRSLNQSDNSAVSRSCTIAFLSSKITDFKYSTFAQNHGTSLFFIYYYTQTVPLSYINIVNNYLSVSLFYCYYSTSSFSQCIIFNNNVKVAEISSSSISISNSVLSGESLNGVSYTNIEIKTQLINTYTIRFMITYLCPGVSIFTSSKASSFQRDFSFIMILIALVSTS